MPKGNDMSQYIGDKYRLLTEMIEKSSETPSQEEMDEIVALFNEIFKLEIMTGESGIQNSDTKKKK